MADDAAYAPIAGCLGCGYPIDLEGTRRCPECGAPFDPSNSRTFQLWRSSCALPGLLNRSIRPPGGWWFIFLPTLLLVPALLLLVELQLGVFGMMLTSALAFFSLKACAAVGAWRAHLAEAQCRQGLRTRPRFNTEYVITLGGVVANIAILSCIFTLIMRL